MSLSLLKKEIETISAKIFQLPYNNNPNTRIGYHILKEKLSGPRLTSYYPKFKVNVTKLNRAWAPIGHKLVDYEDERRLYRLEQLKARGKGAPKKGHGKQAAKNKKKK